MNVIALNAGIAKLSQIADRPSLVALSYALRHPETWPEDFVWDYSDCTTCAIGLATRLWPSMNCPAEQKVQETWIAREMAMSHREAVNIFFGMAPEMIVRDQWYRKQVKFDFDAVRADDVADAIDRYLQVSNE